MSSQSKKNEKNMKQTLTKTIKENTKNGLQQVEVTVIEVGHCLGRPSEHSKVLAYTGVQCR